LSNPRKYQEEPVKRLPYAAGIVTNASYNRSQALECFEAGATPAQIAEHWPAVWKLSPDGKLSQIYDSVYPDGRKETAYMMSGTEDFLESIGLR